MALAARRELERLWLEGRLRRPPPIIGRRVSEGPVPLSFAQEGLWFLDQLHPGSAAYNMRVVVELRTSLDEDALGRALDEIARRHEILRTAFLAPEGHPVSVAGPPYSVPLARFDLRDLPEPERAARAEAHVREEADRPFDLTRGQPVRAVIAHLADERHWLAVIVHHIVFDGWSAGILLRELAALYEGARAGRRVSLPELPIQYGDFARWQRERLEGGLLARETEYWRERLGPGPILTPDFPRPPAQTFGGLSHALPLPDDLADRLTALGRDQGTTPYMTLLAAFLVTLYARTEREDLSLGAVVSSRGPRETANLIGPFVNTVVLRLDLRGNPRFLDVLRQVKERVLEVYAHGEMPYDKLVETLRGGRVGEQPALFDIMFVSAPRLGAPEAWRGVMTPLDLETGVARFDLTVYAVEAPDQLGLIFEYNTDLFAAGSIDRLAEDVDLVLRSMAAAPGERVLSMARRLGERELLNSVID